MKPLIFAGALALLLNCSNKTEDDIELKDDIKPDGHIQVVSGEGTTYNITEAEGEKDLGWLVRNQDKEDAWIFFDGRWVDTGFDESFDYVIQSINFILKKIAEYPGSERLVSQYHIHPNYHCNPPSHTDIFFSININRILAEHGITVVYKVIDPSGVWTYSVTPQMESSLASQPGKEVNLRIGIVNASYDTLFERCGNRDAADENIPAEDIENYIQRMDGLGVVINHRPFETE